LYHLLLDWNKLKTRFLYYFTDVTQHNDSFMHYKNWLYSPGKQTKKWRLADKGILFHGKKKVAHVHAMKAYRGNRCIAPLINLGIWWRWVVNLMLRLLYFREEPQYPLNRWLGGPKSWYGHLEKKIFAPAGTLTPNFPAHNLKIHTILNDSSKNLAWPSANTHFFCLEVRPLQDTKNIPAITCELWALFIPVMI